MNIIKKSFLLFSLIIVFCNLNTDVSAQTKVGYIDGMFSNSEEIKRDLNPVTVSEFFKALKKEVEDYYA